MDAVFAETPSIANGMKVVSESLHRQRYKSLWDLLFEQHPHGQFIRGKWDGLGEKKTDIPPDSLILELLHKQPTALLLDEFQTWFDGLTNTKQYPWKHWAFNFVQILSEIAKEHPELLVLVVSVRNGIGALRQVLKRFKQWRRLEDDVKMLTESGGEPIGRVLTNEEQERLLKTAEDNPGWEHVWCAAQLSANTSMRGVEVKHVRRKDFDAEKRVVHIRASKNETSKRVIPLNDSAFDAVQRMVKRADTLGHSEPHHYLWCASQHHKLDPTKPASNWHTAWRALRDEAGLAGLRFHDLRHTVVTRLLEAGEPDHVVESITGHLSRRMLEHYSHIRLSAKKAALDRLDASARARSIKATK